MERPQDSSFEGKLTAGRYELEGNVSSQFITGLLFALPNVQGTSEIVLKSELESRGYVEMTLHVLRQFGIHVEYDDDMRRFVVTGPQTWKPRNVRVEGDWSQAAFWLVAYAIGNDVTCEGVDADSAQPDRAIATLLRPHPCFTPARHCEDCEYPKQDEAIQYKMSSGLITLRDDSDVELREYARNDEAVEIDVREIPDLVPILAVWLSFRKGGGRIINAERLRLKESDRLKAIATELNKLGGRVQELENGLEIEYVAQLKGGEVDAWNDHRIAMALAIASTRCTEKVTLHGAESVKKSYPNFWKDFKGVTE